MRRDVLTLAQRRLREGSVPVPHLPSGRPLARHNLRTPAYPLVGRMDELDQVRQRLPSTHQQAIISITGLSTIGKSDLALAAAWKVAQEWTDLSYSVVAWVAAPNSPAALGAPRYLERIANVVRPDGLRSEEAWREPVGMTRDQRIELALEALRVTGGALLILDAINGLDSDDVDELRALVRYLPAGCKAIATMNWDLRFGFPLRLPPVHDGEMDVIIEQMCQRHGVSLDADLRHCVRTCAHGVVSVAKRIIDEIEREGPDQARARQDAPEAEWVPSMFGDVFSTTIRRLRKDHPQSYTALHTMSQVQFAGDICQGMTAPALGAALDLDPQSCDMMLQPLLASNLLTRSPSQTYYTHYTMLPITRTYLRCA